MSDLSAIILIIMLVAVVGGTALVVTLTPISQLFWLLVIPIALMAVFVLENITRKKSDSGYYYRKYCSKCKRPEVICVIEADYAHNGERRRQIQYCMEHL
jgi:hypothetical protein